MKERENTIVFIDEIQEYPQFLTMLKFLRADNRFEHIASGSQLGVSSVFFLSSKKSAKSSADEHLAMYAEGFSLPLADHYL